MSDTKEQAIYTFLIAKVKEILPNKRQLRNKFDLTDNDDQFLKDGFSIVVGAGINNQTLNNYFQSLSRTYTISITERVEGRDRDISKFEIAEKELLAKKEALISGLITYKGADKGYSEIRYESDNGVEAIFGEKKNYLFTSIDFIVTYGNKF